MFCNWQILHEVHFQRLVFKANLALSILEIIGFPLRGRSKPTLRQEEVQGISEQNVKSNSALVRI